MKIKELYRRRFPRRPLAPPAPAMPHGPGTPRDARPLPCDHGAAIATALLPAGKRQAEAPLPVHPDVTMRSLPFYDVYDELIRPTTLASTSSQRFEEAHFSFVLSPQQVQQILASRDVLPGAKCDYSVQVQLRFCLCETSCPQEDHFPPNLFVKVNGKLCPLPGFLPPTKQSTEPTRPSRPLNITALARLSATVPNSLVVNWSSEFGRSYSLSVYLVKQLTPVTLLQKLRARGTRNPDHSRALIKEKLRADPDSEIATTSLRVSLVCPLGKTRLAVPCRAATCGHLQCFDAALYLQMNEKKPTWTCPVCDQRAPYDALIVDGLFMEILSSCTDCDEIQFTEDGSWCPMKPKKEKPEPRQAPAFEAASLGPGGSAGRTPPGGTGGAEVIDLTLDSSDEEEPPAKRPRPPASAALPAAPGPKRALSVDHHPSDHHPSVLRSPPMALGDDFLPSLPRPEYPPACPLPSELHGLDLFSFFQSENQRYGPVTALGEPDALGCFFPFRGGSGTFLGALAPPLLGAAPGALRVPPGAGGSAARPGARPDVISLD